MQRQARKNTSPLFTWQTDLPAGTVLSETHLKIIPPIVGLRAKTWPDCNLENTHKQIAPKRSASCMDYDDLKVLWLRAMHLSTSAWGTEFVPSLDSCFKVLGCQWFICCPASYDCVASSRRWVYWDRGEFWPIYGTETSGLFILDSLWLVSADWYLLRLYEHQADNLLVLRRCMQRPERTFSG